MHPRSLSTSSGSSSWTGRLATFTPESAPDLDGVRGVRPPDELRAADWEAEIVESFGGSSTPGAVEAVERRGQH